MRHVPGEDTWAKLRAEDPMYAKLAVSWRLEAEKERKVYVVGGLGAPDRKLCTNAADVMTTCTAIAERMIYARIGGRLLKRGDRGRAHFGSMLGEFRTKVMRALGRSFHPMEAQEFAETYTGRKRRMYESCVEEYLSEGVKAIHAVFKTFMKVEKVPVNKTPRTIQPRDKIYNVGLGRYLKVIEKRVFRAIAKVFGQRYVVFKGLNMNQRGLEMRELYERYRQPVAVGIDASRFDASVERGLLEWEHGLYNGVFHSKELARILKMQLDNKGVAYCHDGKVTYSVRGGRGSGDMNTSLGNSLIMCGIMWSWLDRCGVRASLVNDGDDCVVLMEADDLDKFQVGFPEYALELGFTMVVEPPVYDFEQIEFCQSHPVMANGAWRLVRNIDTAREKDSMCLFPLDNAGAYQSWLYAVGECGLALTSGVPIFQEMYKAMMRSGKASNMADAVFMQSGARMCSVGMDAKESEVDVNARLSFERAFGYTPDEQVALEEYYRSWCGAFELDYGEDIWHVPNAPL